MLHLAGQAIGMKWILKKKCIVFPVYKTNTFMVETLENAEKQRLKIAHNPIISHLMYCLNTEYPACTILYTCFI